LGNEIACCCAVLNVVIQNTNMIAFLFLIQTALCVQFPLPTSQVFTVTTSTNTAVSNTVQIKALSTNGVLYYYVQNGATASYFITQNGNCSQFMISPGTCSLLHCPVETCDDWVDHPDLNTKTTSCQTSSNGTVTASTNYTATLNGNAIDTLIGVSVSATSTFTVTLVGGAASPTALSPTDFNIPPQCTLPPPAPNDPEGCNSFCWIRARGISKCGLVSNSTATNLDTFRSFCRGISPSLQEFVGGTCNIRTTPPDCAACMYCYNPSIPAPYKTYCRNELLSEVGSAKYGIPKSQYHFCAQTADGY